MTHDYRHTGFNIKGKLDDPANDPSAAILAAGAPQIFNFDTASGIAATNLVKGAGTAETPPGFASGCVSKLIVCGPITGATGAGMVQLYLVDSSNTTYNNKRQIQLDFAETAWQGGLCLPLDWRFEEGLTVMAAVVDSPSQTPDVLIYVTNVRQAAVWEA